MRIFTLYLLLFLFGMSVAHGQIVSKNSSKSELTAYHQNMLSKAQHVPNQLILKFSTAVSVSDKSMQTSSSAVNVVLSELSVKSLKPLFVRNQDKHMNVKSEFGLKSYFVLDFVSETDLKDALVRLSNLSEIEIAEPNYLATTTAVPNDPLFPQQWALNNTGQAIQSGTGNLVGTPGVDLNLEQAWDVQTGGGDVTVCILDSGVDTDHPEFAGRLVPGYDFSFDDNDPNPIPGENSGAHGTNCAGIVGASGNNSLGVSGISWGVKIMPVKVLYNNSGSWVDIASGIIWAADEGAHIISMSIGGSSYSSTLENAVDYAYGLGVTLFASSGNSNNDLGLFPSYPGSMANTICVGALSPCGERKNPESCDGEYWWGSNYGADLDLLAPGTRNYSTDITGSDGYDPGDYYPFFNGTSSACPHAAGVAALMLSQNPDLTNAQIRSKMQMSCVDIYNPGFDDQSGWGRLDAYQAVLNATSTQSILKVIPSEWNVIPGQEFSVDFYIENVTNLASYEITCSYEPDYFDYAGYEIGDFIYSTGRTIMPFWFETDPNGYFYFRQETSGLTPPGPDGNGRLFTVNFIANETPPDFSTLQFNISEHSITQPDGTPIIPLIINGAVQLWEGDYCTYNLYSTGCTYGDYFDYVDLANLNNSSSGCSDNGYGDFTYLIADVTAGQFYDLTLEVGFDDQYVSVWVDFNDNMFFEDDEKLVDHLMIDFANELVSTSIFIPESTPPGEHRFRIRTVYGIDTFAPCDPQEYGEVEDYTMNVQAPIPDDYCTESLFYQGCDYGDGIEDFYFEQIYHPQSGCSPNGYGDFTFMATVLTCGQETGVEVSSNYNSQFICIWIDFNDNNTFDFEELILDNEYVETAYDLYYFSMFIPEQCEPGEHRMRVRANYNEPFDDPCGQVEWGEVHDYTVFVVEGEAYGSLQGTVYNWDFDAPQTGIEIYNNELGYSVTTGFDGTYDFGSVPAGFYNLNVDQPGFWTLGVGTEVLPDENEIFDFEVKPIHTNYFNLLQGWSGISSPFYINRDASEVLVSYEDDFVILSSLNGFYMPGENINTLGQWENSPGYKIKAGSEIYFEYPGWMRKPATLSVPAGWSILPCWSECSVNISDLFGLPEVPEPIIIKEIAGTGVYWPEKSVSTLNALLPGNAYLIRQNEPSTIAFPACEGLAAVVTARVKPINNTSWNNPTPTGNSHLIHVPDNVIKAAGLTSGDYLGAFDANGVCFGMVPLAEMHHYALTAFADDIFTGEKDGFTNEEQIYIKAFIAKTGETIGLDVSFDEDMPHAQFFVTDGLSSLNLKSTGIFSGNSNQEKLIQVFPNPTNGMINVNVPPDFDMVSITISDNQGSLVYAQKNDAGLLTDGLQIDLTRLSAGLYTLKITTSSAVFEEKIIIQ
ncbi:MAG: S8 family serine peptidase [Bacteroidales bacterium]|nr:S8 family serine peptidase [Bacteroidales bacterium]